MQHDLVIQRDQSNGISHPVARLDQLSYYPQLMARVAALHAEGYQGTAIASLLNAEGWQSPKRCKTFNGAMVQSLLARLGLRSQRRTPAIEGVPRGR